MFSTKPYICKTLIGRSVPTNIDAVDELIWKRDSITLGRKVASPAAIIPSTIPTIVMSTNEMLRLMTNKLRGKSFILKMKILI